MRWVKIKKAQKWMGWGERLSQFFKLCVPITGPTLRQPSFTSSLRTFHGKEVNQLGLERWLFQRTWVQFPTPTWQLTTVCNSSSRASDTHTETHTEAKHQCTKKERERGREGEREGGKKEF